MQHDRHKHYEIFIISDKKEKVDVENGE